MGTVMKPTFQRMVLGIDVKDRIAFSTQGRLCDTCAYVRNGNELCGDSVFVHMDELKVVVGVFDGVSSRDGVRGSMVAAESTLQSLKDGEPSEQRIVDALTQVHEFLSMAGYMTTAAIACFDESGRYFLGSTGDSPIYLRQQGRVRMMMTLDKMTKSGQDLHEFKKMRHYITSGLGGSPFKTIHTRTGVVSSGAVFVLCSDGLSDNFWVPIDRRLGPMLHAGDVDGASDLASIIKRLRSPSSMVTRLVETLDDRTRVGKEPLWLDNDRVVFPSNDDVAIIALRWK